ncbi:unnamed protein product [Gordionus sp. m RMFG-2023]|uniref:acyl-coenzyme A diphosphatase FITM2-like n=1 Tax=Gordionus sp. m RMFG-2023 TaxID=3053472 RepID=UPI0030E385E0
MNRNTIKNVPPKHIVTTASYSEYFYIISVYIAKTILFSNIETRAAFYLAYILAGSIICDFFTPPTTFLASKYNHLNQYGVKIGWGWTITLLIPFIFSVSYVISNQNILIALKNCSRLLFATGIWYFWTTLFLIIERTVGVCILKEEKIAYSLCHSRGGKWIGLDLSGHIFLLTYCQLIIGEECKIYKYWENFKNNCNAKGNRTLNTNKSQTNSSSLPQNITQLRRCNSWDRIIKYNFLFIALLSLLWEVMILGTILYFHTTIQKFSAALIAVSSWFLTYKMYYTTNKNLSPGIPEDLMRQFR